MAADGVFGPATQRAVKRWQRRHGLVADGIVGPQTRSAMGLGSGPVLKRKRSGSRSRRGSAGRAHHRSHGGGGVRSLQRRIGVPADGVFGPGTEAALKRWQAAHGLVADGVAGPQTRRKLGLGPGRGAEAARPEAEAARGGGRIHRLIRAANRIASAPYKYGGGHGTYHDSGYDCSGSISYALHFAGLLRTPLDSSGFMSYGLPGPGQAHHDLRQLRPRLHGRGRPPLRHQRDPRDGLALDEHAPLVVRVRRAPPARPLIAGQSRRWICSTTPSASAIRRSRREDPRIAARIRAALGDARTV